MLSEMFQERVRQFMVTRIEDLALEAREEFSRNSADAAQRGLLHFGYMLTLHHKTCISQIEKRIAGVFEIQQRVLKALAIPYSATLAQDLKAQMEYYISEIWCGQMIDSYPHMDDTIKGHFHTELYQTRQRVLNKTFLEIDLLVDTLSSQSQNAAQVHQKELEQKFGILLSPTQASRDFDAWKAEFTAGTCQIAVLFVDIDNFKLFNSRYNETIVDKTILPAVMKLLARLVQQRGGAYKQGGEEFVLILPNHDLTEAKSFAEKVRSIIEQSLFEVNGNSERLTVSIGISVCPEHGATYEEVLNKANAAEKVAKRSKNVCVVAGNDQK